MCDFYQEQFKLDSGEYLQYLTLAYEKEGKRIVYHLFAKDTAVDVILTLIENQEISSYRGREILAFIPSTTIEETGIDDVVRKTLPLKKQPPDQ